MEAYSETATVAKETWATLDAQEILAQIHEHAAKMRDALSGCDSIPTIVLSRKQLKMLVERASPAARVALAGALCNPGGPRLVIAEDEERQRHLRIALAAEETMRRDGWVSMHEFDHESDAVVQRLINGGESDMVETLDRISAKYGVDVWGRLRSALTAPMGTADQLRAAIDVAGVELSAAKALINRQQRRAAERAERKGR